jgi:putative transposase
VGVLLISCPVNFFLLISLPAEYPWSSYHGNALNKDEELLSPHHCYLSLGTSKEARKQAYKYLFKHHIPELTLQEIRDATNKAWVLGENRFKQQIEQQTGRRAIPLARGGDRKSKSFRGIVSCKSTFLDLLVTIG